MEAQHGQKTGKPDFLNVNHLKVLTPITTDGITPILVNDVIQYSEAFLPITAKPYLERKNEKLPPILKKKIFIVDANGNEVTAPQRGPGRPPKNSTEN
jgi:hypothetical protein